LTILFLMTRVEVASSTDSDDYWFTWSDTSWYTDETVEHPTTPKSTTSTASTSSYLELDYSSLPSTTKVFCHHQVLLVVQFLCHLHSGPTSSEVSRKTKVKHRVKLTVGPPPLQGNLWNICKYPKSVAPSQRVRQNMGENLPRSVWTKIVLSCLLGGEFIQLHSSSLH